MSGNNRESGIDYGWERIRYLTRWHADYITRRKTTAFESGDIACCHGSIEMSFYDHLKALQYPLEKWESERQVAKPLRFCVINRHCSSGMYEVFLMTTFGQARTFDELGTIAHKYGIPVGGMNWVEDITPISTYPAYFGWEAKSFIFAIPTVVNSVIPTMLPRTPRLVSGELERLRTISDLKMRYTDRVHRLVRESLRQSHLYKFGASSLSLDDAQDEFMPHNDEESDIDLEVPIQESSAHINIANCQIKPKKLPPPIERNDVTWVLSHARRDIQNYSTYLSHRGLHRRGPIRLQLGRNCSLPQPYFSSSLRLKINSICRILP